MKVGVWLPLHERAVEKRLAPLDGLLSMPLFTQPQIHPDILEALKFVSSKPAAFELFYSQPTFSSATHYFQALLCIGRVYAEMKEKKLKKS